MSGTEARLTRLSISFVLDYGRRTADGPHKHRCTCRKHPPLRAGAEQKHLALGDPVFLTDRSRAYIRSEVEIRKI
jgi:hypothetical protein